MRAVVQPLAQALIALGISANALTFLGFVLNAGVGLLAARGSLVLAGVLYLLFSCLDFLDGAVARLSGSAGPFGAFFDSLLDRASEAVVLIGLVYWFSDQQRPLLAATTGLALAGSFLVSYARARAEGLGYDCEVGWLQRPERIVALGLGLVLSPLHELLLPVVVAMVAVVTAVTTIQRLLHVHRLAR